MEVTYTFQLGQDLVPLLEIRAHFESSGSRAPAPGCQILGQPQWVSLGSTGSTSQTLTFISMFFKDGLEKFEVNRKVQLSNRKSGFRIDAEKTANRLLEGIAFVSSY